eukprot:Pgem_evm1s20172
MNANLNYSKKDDKLKVKAVILASIAKSTHECFKRKYNENNGHRIWLLPCKVGLAGKCSHIGVLLLVIFWHCQWSMDPDISSDYARTCTEMLCLWAIPGLSRVKPIRNVPPHSTDEDTATESDTYLQDININTDDLFKKIL